MDAPSPTPISTSSPSTPVTNQNVTSASTTCKKIIKILAVIFLTIITLGLYLIWKYYRPCPPIVTQPTPTSDITAPILIGPQGKLIKMPWRISHDSLTFLHELEKKGLNPPTSQRFTLFGANPDFIATYPQSISSIYADAISDLQEQATSPIKEERVVAEAILAQLRHLDQHYYVAAVPGDHYCFFRSYAISWFCALNKQKRTNPLVFEQEIQKLRLLPFANSSHQNAILTQQAINVLQKCQQCTSIQQLYNEVILDSSVMQPFLQYLRQLAFYTADQQKIEVLGEANLRTLLLEEINEDPSLCEQAVSYFLGSSYSSHLFLEQALIHAKTFDFAWQEALFILEFLPICLLSQQKLSALPDEDLVSREVQTALSNFLLSLDNARKLGTRFSNRHIRDLIQENPSIKRQFDAFTQNWKLQYPHLKVSKTLCFYFFLRTHPCYINTNPHCKAFIQHIATCAQIVTGTLPSFSQFLQLSPSAVQAYDKMISTCKVQSISINLVEALVQFPLTTTPASSTTLPLTPSHEPTILRRFYDALLYSLINVPLSKAEQQQALQMTRLFYASASTALINQILIFRDHLLALYSQKRDASQLSEPLVLFLFFTQNPKQLEQVTNQEAILNLCSIFMPPLQNSMYAYKSLLPVRLLAQVYGHLCSIRLPSNDQSATTMLTSVLLLMFEDLHAAHLLQTLFHLPSLFGHQLPKHQEIENLIKEVKTALPDAWEHHVNFIKVLSRGMHLNSSHPTLGPAFLLISFLMQNQDLIESVQQSLKDRLNMLVKSVQQIVANYIKSLSLIQQNLLTIQYSNILPQIQNVQRHIITHLTSRDTNFFLRLIITRGIEQMNLDDLLRFSHNIFYQAEDEHVAAMSSTLGGLSLCQSLRDPQFINNPQQILPLSNTHGFLSLDYLPDASGTIFVLREGNHYFALLPKDDDEDMNIENASAHDS